MPFDCLAAAGCLCLGLFVGALVRRYSHQRATFLAGVISVLAGMGVLALFHVAAPPGQSVREYWLYPLGCSADSS